MIWAVCFLGFGLTYAFTGAALSLVLWLASVLLPALAIFLAALGARGLEAELELPETVEKNQPAAFCIHLRNRSRIPLLRVKAPLRLENVLTGEQAQFVAWLAVGAKGQATAAFQFASAHCGALRAGIQGLRAYDCFGLVPLRARGGADQNFLSLPETFSIRISLPQRSSAAEESEQYSQERPGFDFAEVFQVRDYAEGDSLKQIHWKLTTKFDRLIARDPGLPLERSVLLLWERGTGPSGETPRQTDAMAEVLVSVCRALNRQGVGCRVVWNEAGTGACSELFLQEEDDLYAMLPRLLAAGQDRSGATAPELYLRLNGPVRQSKVIYLGTWVSPALEDLCPGEAPTVLCCGAVDAGGPGRVFSFDPVGYADALAELDLY